MFGSELLEVAIGLTFLFLVLSVALSAAREAIEAGLQTRAIHLERGIRELLRDKQGRGLARQVYEHPLVASLYRGDYQPHRLTRRWLGADTWPRAPFGSQLPAYIPARNFALALLDIAARGTPAGAPAQREIGLERLREGLSGRLADPVVRRAVLLAVERSQGDVDVALAHLQAWFDSGMDRVSGWYRKETQWMLLGMGLVAAFALNIDTLQVARAVYRDTAVRGLIVAEAQAFANAAGEGADGPAMLRALGCGPELASAHAKALSCSQRRLAALDLPFGWQAAPAGPWSFGWDIGAWLASFPWASLPGWLLTALAVSMGAPFWFDVLNRAMVIRSTVKPHEKSREEESEDRRTVAPRASA